MTLCGAVRYDQVKSLYYRQIVRSEVSESVTQCAVYCEQVTF